MNTNLVDMHIHILPKVDDGSGSSEETKAMLKREYDMGVRTIVATPHCIADEKAAERAERIKAAYEKSCRLCKEVAEETGGEEIKLLLGNEIYCSLAVTDGILEMIKRGEAFTLNNSRYVLIEVGYTISFTEMFRIIKKFDDAGYVPVLAHVERYDALYKNWEYIEKLIDYGVIIQMNAESLSTPKGFMEKLSKLRKWCWQLMEVGCVHVLGSDAHRDKNGNNIAEAVANIQKKLGEKKIRQLIDNSNKIINNEQF